MPTYKGIVFKHLDRKDLVTKDVGFWLLQPDGSVKFEGGHQGVAQMVQGEQEIPEWADDDINEALPGDWTPGAKVTPQQGAAYCKFILWAYNRGGIWAEPLFA